MLQKAPGFNIGVAEAERASMLRAVALHDASTPANAPSLLARAWPDLAERQAELKARYLLRLDALDRLERALRGANARALLVKGAATAALYPKPWLRPMADVDLIVRLDDLARIRPAVAGAGFHAASPLDRPLTESALEIQVTTPSSVAPVLVEMHLGLDKVVLRRTDLEGVFARATPFGDSAVLSLPSKEDQALFVVLHLAADEFRHLPGFVDLEVLFAAGLDSVTLSERARRWSASTIAFVALRTLEHLRPGLVPPDLVASLAPSSARRALVSAFFDVGAWPVARTTTTLGWPWLLRQTALRDDSMRWALGLLGYGARRALERSIVSR